MSRKTPASDTPSGEGKKKRDRSGAEPEGWRTGPAWREMDGRAARRRRRTAMGAAALLVAAGAVWVVNPGDIRARLSGNNDTVAAAPLPPETAAPTAAPGQEAGNATPTLERPFAGSPAERYADGPAGIVLPPAKATGWMDKEQVARALRQAKQWLVSANLDPTTLSGGQPKAALELTDPQQPGTLELMRKALRSPGAEHDPLSFFSRFDPTEVRPAGDIVKTRGRMTYEADDKDGTLVIHADYTFVYPVVKARVGAHEVTRTIVRRQLDLEFTDPARYQNTPGKLGLGQYQHEASNSSCARDDGFLHPMFATDAPDGPEPSGEAVDPYDRSRDLSKEPADSCGTVSRV
ncbi:hypothetical protein [Streptomyces sp. NPDC003077]|uniref:hypothetical protein n=1 Tax=Streptomyces sp. NPDC003077 TaxID=3154443 RepID=UPI0033B8E461